MIDTARVRKATDKARVERTVRVVAEDCFGGEEPLDIEAARQHALWWCREENGMRRHGTTQRLPAEHFESEEKARLHPAPSEPYVVPAWSKPKVARDQHAAVARALYSLPDHYKGRRLDARADPTTVRFYDPYPNLVKTHPRVPPGKRQTDPSDFPPEKAAYALRDLSYLVRKAQGCGEAVGRYAEALLESRLPWTRMRQVYALLGLGKRYGAARLEQACKAALEVELVNVYKLQRLLEIVPRSAHAATADADKVVPIARYLRPPHQFSLTLLQHQGGLERRRSAMNAEAISPDLKKTLRRLKLSRLLDTLPERLTLARQQKMPYQDFLLIVLGDEATRRDTQAARLRAQKAQLDPAHQFERWDDTADVSFDRELLNEIASLRFVESNLNVDIVGPVGVGKTFLAHAIGHIACRRGFSVLAVQADRMLKTLKQARLLDSYEAELRKLISVDLLIVDDFALDAMDAQESRDVYDIFCERQRSGSLVVTSNRGLDEWLATFADPLRAQSAIDRFNSTAYDLVIEGESYRSRQKPSLRSARGGVRA